MQAHQSIFKPCCPSRGTHLSHLYLYHITNIVLLIIVECEGLRVVNACVHAFRVDCVLADAQYFHTDCVSLYLLDCCPFFSVLCDKHKGVDVCVLWLSAVVVAHDVDERERKPCDEDDRCDVDDSLFHSVIISFIVV